MAALLLLLAAAATAIDLSVSQQFRPRKRSERFHPVLGPFTTLITLSEAFGYGGTVILFVVLAGSLDPAGWRSVPRMAAGAFGGGLGANLIKMSVGRLRPKAANLDQSLADTFQGWLPWIDEATRGHHAQSFPSAHTATAFGLATVLAWKYPRGRMLFYALASLTGLQRVQVLDHFLSDVLSGAALGILCGTACIAPHLAGRWFDRLEQAARRNGSNSR